jgi:Flp pilus assembly protein TadD
MSDILSKLQLPRDTPLSGEDIIRALQDRIKTLEPGTMEHSETLFELMRYYGLSGMVDEALSMLETLLEADTPIDGKARAALVVATCVERTGDFGRAILVYRRALSFVRDLAPETLDPYTAYFAHNNLAYSLNQTRSFEEGEAEARAAIAVDPNRHNAHKNLGVAVGLARRARTLLFEGLSGRKT